MPHSTTWHVEVVLVMVILLEACVIDLRVFW